MESRFAHLRQRDTSASMLRVKMSRRRSQSQKENRERTVNTRRQLDKLPELDISSLDASIAMANMSTIQEKTQNNAKFDKSRALFSITAQTYSSVHKSNEAPAAITLYLNVLHLFKCILEARTHFYVQ